MEKGIVYKHKEGKYEGEFYYNGSDLRRIESNSNDMPLDFASIININEEDWNPVENPNNEKI